MHIKTILHNIIMIFNNIFYYIARQKTFTHQQDILLLYN